MNITITIIMLKNQNQIEFHLGVRPQTTALEIKECVEIIHKIPVERQRLSYENRVIKDKNPISEYDIQDGDQLLLLVELTSMVLRIRYLDNTEYLVIAEPNLTIEYLKLIIQSKTEIPSGDQRLIFRGRQLEDGRILRDYGLENGSVIHLLLRLRGS